MRCFSDTSKSNHKPRSVGREEFFGGSEEEGGGAWMSGWKLGTDLYLFGHL